MELEKIVNKYRRDVLIKKNLDILEEEIQNICDRVGRNRDEIEIIAVTKTLDLDLIEEAIDYKYNSIGIKAVRNLGYKEKQRCIRVDHDNQF